MALMAVAGAVTAGVQGLTDERIRANGGEVDYIVAFGTDGRIGGVRVLHHAETPGFADILTPQSAWLAGFGAGGDQVHAVTGATITSRAIIDGVIGTTRRHMEGSGCLAMPTEVSP